MIFSQTIYLQKLQKHWALQYPTTENTTSMLKHIILGSCHVNECLSVVYVLQKQKKFQRNEVKSDKNEPIVDKRLWREVKALSVPLSIPPK